MSAYYKVDPDNKNIKFDNLIDVDTRELRFSYFVRIKERAVDKLLIIMKVAIAEQMCDDGDKSAKVMKLCGKLIVYIFTL